MEEACIAEAAWVAEERRLEAVRIEYEQMQQVAVMDNIMTGLWMVEDEDWKRVMEEGSQGMGDPCKYCAD